MGRKEISSIIPDHINGKQRPIPNIKWNDKTMQSCKEKGLWDAEYPPFKVNGAERRFLSEEDERQGPIKRVVTRMIQLKAIDYTTENLQRKEYLYY
jgi:hypothetical protein